MKFNTLYSILFIFLVTLTNSCTEDITDQISKEVKKSYPKLVVEAQITTDTTAHMVKLTRLVDYFSNVAPDPVTNAHISISDGTSSIALTESSDLPGEYFTPVNSFGIPGKTYTLTIDNVDIDKDGVTEQYKASSKLNAVTTPDSIRITVIKRIRAYQYQVNLYMTDPAYSTDAYLFKVLRNGIMLSDSLDKYNFTNDEYFNGSNTMGASVYTLRPRKTSERLQLNDIITLEVCGVTQDYIDFLTDIRLESYGSDPFGGQPANVSTNIEPKAKAAGFFIAYSIKRISATVRDTVPQILTK